MRAGEVVRDSEEDTAWPSTSHGIPGICATFLDSEDESQPVSGSSVSDLLASVRELSDLPDAEGLINR